MLSCPNCGSTFLRAPAPKWYDRLPGMAARRVSLVCWHCGWKGRADDLNRPPAESRVPSAASTTPGASTRDAAPDPGNPEVSA